MAHILNMGEALSRVAADVAKMPLPFKYVERLAEVSLAMHRNGRGADGTVLATILLRATEACVDASDKVLWGEAAYAYLQCLTYDLREKPDVPLYVKVAAVADRLVGGERATASGAGDNDRLARALSCSGQLRLAIAVRDRAGPEYWDQNGSWRSSAIVRLGLADPVPADYRLDNALSVVTRAAEELQEAADLRSGDARAGSLIMVAQALHWLHLAS
jgi:hypothetical protein